MRNLLLFGSCTFSERILNGLLQAQKTEGFSRAWKLGGIVTRSSKSGGEDHGGFIKLATSENLSIFTVPLQGLKGWSLPPAPESLEQPWDLGIVASFGYFIPSRIVRSFKSGMFVVHPSLLPKYRGASPMIYTLMNQDKETGVSCIEVAKEIDGGVVLTQSKIGLRDNLYYDQLEKLLADLAVQDILKIIEHYESFKDAAKAQSHYGHHVSYAPKISDCTFAEISFSHLSSLQIFALHRAISHRYKLRACLETAPGKPLLSCHFLEILDPKEFCFPVSSYQSKEAWDQASGGCPSGTIYREKGRDLLWIKCCTIANVATADFSSVEEKQRSSYNDWLACSKFLISGKSMKMHSGQLMGFGLQNFACHFN